MPFIGGLILIFILGFGLWSLMFPVFSKVGNFVVNKYNKFKQEEIVNDKSKDI